MDDITVVSQSYGSEDRSWLMGPHGVEAGTTPSTTIDLSKFTDAKFADTIKSGCVLGRITATGLYGPYDPAAVDGRQTARRLTMNTYSRKPGDGAKRIADGGVIHAFVNKARLPYTGIGGLDADGEADMSHLIVVDDI